MGAAGLTSSSCEMAARAGNGIELDLTLVPQRETGMTAYEMMLSESQERMLIVAHSGRERQVVDIFHKWDLDAVVIGRVTDTGSVVVIHEGERLADIPVEVPDRRSAALRAPDARADATAARATVRYPQSRTASATKSPSTHRSSTRTSWTKCSKRRARSS